MESLSQICLQNLDLASALASINYFSKYLSSIVISLNSTHQQVGEYYFSHWRHNGRQSFHHEKKMCWGEKCRLTKKNGGKVQIGWQKDFIKKKGVESVSRCRDNPAVCAFSQKHLWHFCCRQTFLLKESFRLPFQRERISKQVLRCQTYNIEARHTLQVFSPVLLFLTSKLSFCFQARSYEHRC